MLTYVHCTAILPYISATNGLMSTCHLLLLFFLQNYYMKNMSEYASHTKKSFIIE